jgi:hypothetical protein
MTRGSRNQLSILSAHFYASLRSFVPRSLTQQPKVESPKSLVAQIGQTAKDKLPASARNRVR